MSLLHADVAVIGSELCGMAAGALLAHSHLRVVVIPDGERENRPLGDYLVPRVPTLWRMPQGGPASKLIEELGLKQEVRRALGTPVGIGLIDDPDIRMVLETEPEVRRQELTRVFGDLGENIDEALAAVGLEEREALLLEATRIHEDGFFARRREKRRLDDVGAAADPQARDPAVARALQTPLAAALPYLLPYVQSAAEAPVASLGGYFALTALTGGTVISADDGLGLRTTLSKLFGRVIQGHGGDVLDDALAVEVMGGGKKLTHVKTGTKNDYKVAAVIDATVGRSLNDRLPDGRALKKTEELEQSVPKANAPAIVRWLLPRDATPRGMPPRALVLPEEAGQAGGGLLAVYDDLPKSDGKRPKQGDDDVVAAVISHWSKHEATEKTATALEDRLDHLFPFARDRLLARDELKGEEAWLAQPTYATAGTDLNPLGGRRPRTGFANLLRAGRDLVPRLGLAGELAASRAVAAATLGAVGKKS